MQRRTTVLILMAAVAASLVVAGSIHLRHGNSGSGIPELVIAGVVAGTAIVASRREQWLAWALGGTGFAIAGFLLGLSFTIRGHSSGDVAYHIGGLVVLAATFALAIAASRRLVPPATRR